MGSSRRIKRAMASTSPGESRLWVASGASVAIGVTERHIAVVLAPTPFAPVHLRPPVLQPSIVLRSHPVAGTHRAIATISAVLSAARRAACLSASLAELESPSIVRGSIWPATSRRQ